MNVFWSSQPIDNYMNGLTSPSIASTATVTKVDVETPLPQLFGQMEWSAWEEASLEDTVKYLRGCSKLEIPSEYRLYLPTEWMED